ncbi:MAG: sigma-70 family RNA polymerase sigma factor [Oscillospiraceae bacterium]|nr:sigma-70 family RNA polymerase sigma factor [Oscillospiraceae bacterium]
MPCLKNLIPGPRAADRLVDQWGPAVYRFCRSLTWSREDGEDLFQETFLRTLERPGVLRDEEAARRRLNIATMNGNYGEFVEDGVLYRLLECDTVAIFADRGLYLGVCQDFIPGADTFLFDPETGEIAANPDYPGLSVVLDLPLDPALADPVRAEEYLDAIYNPEFIALPSLP